MSSECVYFERENYSSLRGRGLALPYRQPPHCVGHVSAPAGSKWDLGWPLGPRVSHGPAPGGARSSQDWGKCPSPAWIPKGSEGWIEPLKGSSKEGPPKFGGNLYTTLLGEVPKRQGKVPWEPPVPFRPFLGHRSNLELATPWFLAIRRLSAVNLEINGRPRHSGP